MVDIRAGEFEANLARVLGASEEPRFEEYSTNHFCAPTYLDLCLIVDRYKYLLI